MKRDPYKHKERWEKWKTKVLAEGIQGISQENSKIILQYLKDMEMGLNISSSSSRGPRAPIRLNTLRIRMIFFAKHFEERFRLNSITDLSEEQLLQFFSDLRHGVVKTKVGKSYKSIGTIANIFKAFWHWHQKRSNKQDRKIQDITIDLDTFEEKPKWVFLDEKQMWQVCNAARFDYRVLFTFLIDTGIRSPTELVNVKVSDIYRDFKELEIRHETAKKGSFGRKIKLMLCRDLLREFIAQKQLKSGDYVFDIKPGTVNKYLKSLTVKLFGDKVSEAGKNYSEISIYDFRHISCCYWLPRYKSESALKYRFGWKQSDKIHYYSELLGMRDTISEEDLLIDVTKTELEQRLTKLESENQVLREKLIAIEDSLATINVLSDRIEKKVSVMDQANNMPKSNWCSTQDNGENRVLSNN